MTTDDITVKRIKRILPVLNAVVILAMVMCIAAYLYNFAVNGLSIATVLGGLFIAVSFPLAAYFMRMIPIWIHAYEHAYDHNDIALRLMAHANEVRASDEGRPTDQP